MRGIGRGSTCSDHRCCFRIRVDMAQGCAGQTLVMNLPRAAIGLVALDGVEEVLGALGLGMVEELVGRAGFHDLAVGHKDDAVGYAAGKVHLVRDDDHRHALLRQTDHDLEHLVDHLGVKGARGLVKEHGLGLHGE